MQEDQVEHVERADRRDAGDQRAFTMAVERLQSEAAGIDLAALRHELLDLLVHRHVAGEGLVAKGREAALHAKRDAGAVEQNVGGRSLCARCVWPAAG